MVQNLLMIFYAGDEVLPSILSSYDIVLKIGQLGISLFTTSTIHRMNGVSAPFFPVETPSWGTSQAALGRHVSSFVAPPLVGGNCFTNVHWHGGAYIQEHLVQWCIWPWSPWSQKAGGLMKSVGGWRSAKTRWLETDLLMSLSQ